MEKKKKLQLSHHANNFNFVPSGTVTIITMYQGGGGGGGGGRMECSSSRGCVTQPCPGTRLMRLISNAAKLPAGRQSVLCQASDAGGTPRRAATRQVCGIECAGSSVRTRPSTSRSGRPHCQRFEKTISWTGPSCQRWGGGESLCNWPRRAQIRDCMPGRVAPPTPKPHPA